MAAALGVAGVVLKIGTSSPASTVVANVEDFTIPTECQTKDVTNVSDTWQRLFPTLLQMGKIDLKVFFVATDASHKNAASGLRYLMLNKTLAYIRIEYPDTGTPVDAFQAYVTSFKVTGKVADVFHADVTFSMNDQSPQIA